MKSGFLWCIAGGVLVFSVSWSPKSPQLSSTARVKRLMGVCIFIQSRPVRAFDTVCVLTTRKNLESYPGPSTPNVVKGLEPPIDALVNQAIRLNRKHDKAVRKGKKPKRKRIDAIITDDARTAVGVCWEKESKLNDYDNAIVLRDYSIPFFIRSEPIQPYIKRYKVEIPSRLDLTFTGYKSLSNMLNALDYQVRLTTDTARVPADGFITENGFSGWIITYKK